jgi:ankyrin repeat protein
VRINWNDHTRKLQEISATTFNFESLVEFLCSDAFPKSKYKDVNRILFKHALEYSGNVTVFMDGFDEISSTHVDKAAVILSELMKTKVERVWVTSRPVQREKLEKGLSVIAFSLKRLSQESQKEMLRNVLKYNADEREEELNHFLLNVNESVHDENFTGCPLYITMIVTVYEKQKERHLNLEDSQWPEIDLVNMYEVLVDSKLHIYLSKKRKAEETTLYDRDVVEWLKEPYLKNFEKCALVAILPPSILKSLHNNKIEEEIQSVLSRVQDGKDKTGIVMNVVDGKPQFVHPTFGEYFTALWFSRKFELNRIVMERILFDNTYRVMRDVFDKMLAKGCPLHYAVLQRDRERFETLLEEGCDVSAVDKGGRTIMHIIATRDCTFLDIVNRVTQYEASLDKRDSVLQWTPLQYATKSEKWFIVERLLEHNVDRSGLDMIRQRAQDPDYINPIILHAATYGHLLLLELLCSIGVNIHQASSRGSPSPLHAAIQGEQLQVVRWLIQHGADCNTRYSDGQKPLFLAVTKGSFDVVRALVEDGGASLDTRDVHGNTAIDWAKGYTSVPMYRYTFLWKYRVEKFKEIVKYLQENSR